MLVLTRRLEEKVIIGEGPDAIEITVVLIDRNKVRLGFKAPRHLLIMRKELLTPEQTSGREGTLPESDAVE